MTKGNLVQAVTAYHTFGPFLTILTVDFTDFDRFGFRELKTCIPLPLALICAVSAAISPPFLFLVNLCPALEGPRII